MNPLFWGNLDTIDQVATALQNGGVVLAEGDTVLGLLADVSDKGAEHLNAIKKRSKKPYLLLVTDQQKALDLVHINPEKISQIEKIMDICWPGPVTMIFKAKSTACHMVTSLDNTLAIRVPDHAGLQQLLPRFQALFSTSANMSGQAVPNTLAEVESGIASSVECIVVNDISSGPTIASTIIDCTGDTFKIVREGAFSAPQLADLLG